jgi:hypothetical protein
MLHILKIGSIVQVFASLACFILAKIFRLDLPHKLAFISLKLNFLKMRTDMQFQQFWKE